MNISSIKSRIEKALKAIPPGNPRIIVYSCPQDADELEREMARDAALEGHQTHDGPLIILCLETPGEEFF